VSPPWMWDDVCAEGHLCARAFVREEEDTLCGICVGEIEFYFFIPALVGFGAFVCAHAPPRERFWHCYDVSS
jgi:hypothetical protein